MPVVKKAQKAVEVSQILSSTMPNPTSDVLATLQEDFGAHAELQQLDEKKGTKFFEQRKSTGGFNAGCRLV